MKAKIYILTIAALLVILTLGKIAPAAGVSGGISIPNPLGPNCEDVGCVLQRIAGFLLLIATPILTIMVLWAGFLLLSSGGDPKRVQAGQKALLWAVIGFAIILINWGFASIVEEILGGGN